VLKEKRKKSIIGGYFRASRPTATYTALHRVTEQDGKLMDSE